MGLIYKGKVISARSYILKRKVWHNVRTQMTKWDDIIEVQSIAVQSIWYDIMGLEI